ncbi:MAG TPA: arylamine N-acetyltransferase [Bacillota bacterium]|nr:arylamine N-acetyltransferase [Bacillota bacterium]
MDVENYIQRIGCSIKEPSFKHLVELQRTHLQTVPFENLDVIRNVPIYLSLPHIYEKIVTHHRGGYCYELNGLFHWALREMGYDARMVPASVMRPSGFFAKKHTHVAILVVINGMMYVTDVGFGNQPLAPIPLDGTTYTDPSGTYYIQHQQKNVYRLMKRQENSWNTVYEFSTDEWELTDFHEGCVFNQISPESTFTHTDIVSLATKDGRITLKDAELLTIQHGEKTIQALTETEKMNTLMDTFNIRL